MVVYVSLYLIYKIGEYLFKLRSVSIVWIYLRWSDYNFSFNLFYIVFLFYTAENVGGLGGKSMKDWRRCRKYGE